MALETIRDLKRVDGFKVAHMEDMARQHPEMVQASGQLDWKFFEKEIRPEYPVLIRHEKNSLTLTIQNGPVAENGVNGCQVDTLLHLFKIMVGKLDENFPCCENLEAIGHANLALAALRKRTERRVRMRLEGTNKEA